MKRYLILGRWKESDGEKRRAGRDMNFYPAGDGRIIIAADLEERGWCIIAECEGPIEDYLADLIRQADVEIKPIKLCPKDCNWCPPTMVKPLRKEM